MFNFSSVLKIFNATNITGRGNSTDSESIWQSWAQERAYRIGLVLSACGLLLSVLAIGINYYFLGSVAAIADALLLLGCSASFFLTRRNASKRYFVWWPMLLGYWLAIQPNIFLTGGVNSPFFTTFMILLLVGAVVIQSEIRLKWIVSFVVLNVIAWIALDQAAAIPAHQDLPFLYIISLNVDCILAIALCIYGFLKTEQELAREFEARYVELNTTQESLVKEEAANASKSAFLANISHELRTPLGAILGYIDLLLDEKYSETEQREQLSIIKRNGNQLSRLVDDLLDLSKIEAGRLEIEKLEVNFLPILTEIYDTFSLAASKKNLAFNVKFLNPIPQKLAIDPIRFKQILINLVGNAIKFTEEGRVELNVEYVDPVQQLKVSIRDTGRGLTREEQDKLFQPFSQADASMARKYGGTGLGLNLSRRLARLMGGDLKLSFSRPGEGSIFSLWVDATASSEGALTSDFTVSHPTLVSSKPDAPNMEQAELLKDVSVLIVDDTADNRSLIRKFLELSGATVDTANDGTEGIQKALEENFDLVLMDIQMPGLDGLQATSLLRQRNYKKPIVALTAHAMRQDRDRCLDAGCSDYLTKPVNRRELVSTVRKLANVKANNSVVEIRR